MIVPPKYRPEIDGLRALAVFAVVIYHADFIFRGDHLLKGGFIGVDIFFVISGYLITSIILREMHAGNFSFAGFYERRARRILPALFTVISASIPFAWFFLLPTALKEYSGSILSSIFFGSNIWFLNEDSYWAEPSALKPFLHTWSLSVEEQFYVLFPIFLIFLWRFFRKYIGTIFIVACVFFLLLAQVKSMRHPDAAFYLLPYRGWELLGGGILAKMEQDHGRIGHRLLSNFMPALGLLLICASFVFFNDHLPHPSFVTALPVLGTMMLIWYCKQGELISDVLASKYFVAIGLVSYSFYLWHFPIFAFTRIKGVPLSNYDKLGLIFLALSLSAITYFLIEKPTRNKKIVGPGVFTGSIVVALLVLTGIQGAFFITDGVPGRLGVNLDFYNSFQRANYKSRCSAESETELLETGVCSIGFAGKKPDYLVIGDSHSLSLLQLFDDLGHENQTGGGFLFYSGCPPLVDIYRKGTGGQNDACPKMNRKALEFARNNAIKHVFLIARWNFYTDFDDRLDISNVPNPESWSLSNSRRVLEVQLAKTISEYHKLGVKPIIVLQVPHQKDNPLSYFHEAFQNNSVLSLSEALDSTIHSKSISFSEHVSKNKMSDSIIYRANAPGIADVIDSGQLLCDDICALGSEEHSYYFDDDHLSLEGAKRLRLILTTYFKS